MNPIDLHPADSTDMAARAEAVAEALRTSFSNVVQEVTGPAMRPSRLVTRLGVDKSLASRITRSLRSDTPSQLLHFIPSPSGLGIFLEAAGEAGVPGDVRTPALHALENLENLLAEVPGGRSGLQALISEDVAEVRHRVERSAAQAIHRGMTSILGFQCEALSSALILHPSRDGRWVDGLEIGYREGVRRLRPSAPAALFSVNLARTSGDGVAHLETLDGETGPTDPRALLVPEFCVPEEPPLKLVQNGDHVIFALADGAETLHRPINVCSAFYIRNGWVPRRTEENPEEGRDYLLPYPCRTLIRDLYIHEDIWFGAEPYFQMHFPRPGGVGRESDPEVDRLNRLDMVAPVERLAPGSRAVESPEIAAHGRIVRHAFDRLGMAPEAFRGYRVRLSYPVPMIVQGWWVTLPPDPPATTD